MVFGPCFGGLMGLQIAQEMPERIAGMVITSPPYEFPDFPWIEKADCFLHNKVEQKSKEKGVSFIKLKRLAILHRLFVASSKTLSKAPLLKKYHGPMTIFHGEKDPLIPVQNSFQIQLFMQNPNLQLKVVPNMKHTIGFDKEMKMPINILKQYLNNIRSPQ